MFSNRSSYDRTPNRWSIAAASRVGTPNLLDLTLSNPTRVGLPYDESGILAALTDRRALVYEPEPFGSIAARQAIRGLWQNKGFELDDNQIFLTASTSEAYSCLFKLLCDPGDEVLVPVPSYPLFEHLARYDSVRVVPYELAYDGRWYLPQGAIERVRSPRARAILTVNPNNPTGSFLTVDALETLSRAGLPLISDEVFADYELTSAPDRVFTALAARHNLVFCLAGLSKSALLPQLKLGWTVVSGPRPLVNEALARLELILDTYLSPSAVVQFALPRLLEATAGTRLALVQRLKHNLRTLSEQLAGTPASVLHVEGGWYATLRLPATRSEEDWVTGLLDSCDVLVQPGFFYDFGREPLAVLSLLGPPEQLLEASQRIADYVTRSA